MKTLFRIKRYDPENDSDSHDEQYEVEVDEGMTLLDCINHIKWTIDGSLTYRMSCGSAICGSCGMKVNGVARLACNTQALAVIKAGVVSIEPLGNLEVVKDLVVELEPFWDKLARVRPWLMNDDNTAPTRERLQSTEDFARIEPSSTCIMCACCYSECQSLRADEGFLGPAALAKAQRFIDDSRDQERMSRLRAVCRKDGIWDCMHCGECSGKCPTLTSPVDRIMELRQASLRSGVVTDDESMDDDSMDGEASDQTGWSEPANDNCVAVHNGLARIVLVLGMVVVAMILLSVMK